MSQKKKNSSIRSSCSIATIIEVEYENLSWLPLEQIYSQISLFCRYVFIRWKAPANLNAADFITESTKGGERQQFPREGTLLYVTPLTSCASAEWAPWCQGCVSGKYFILWEVMLVFVRWRGGGGHLGTHTWIHDFTKMYDREFAHQRGELYRSWLFFCLRQWSLCDLHLRMRGKHTSFPCKCSLADKFDHAD